MHACPLVTLAVTSAAAAHAPPLMPTPALPLAQAGWTLQKVLEIPLSPCPCAVCEWATAEGQPPKRLHAPLPRSAAVAYSYLAVPPTSLTEALELLAAIQEVCFPACSMLTECCLCFIVHLQHVCFSTCFDLI